MPRKEIRKIVRKPIRITPYRLIQGFRRHAIQPRKIEVEHIFPYRISDYVQYRYEWEWYFRWMPRPLFRALERRFGWHLLLTGEAT